MNFIKCFSFFALLMIFSIIGYANNHAAQDHSLKQASIMQYVINSITWPKENQPTNGYTICVLNKNATSKDFESLKAKKEFNVKKLTHYKQALEPKHCQVLFVDQSLQNDYQEIFEALSDKPILTFGNENVFTIRGGMINFQQINDQTAIQLNLPKIKSSGFKISDEMYKLVVVIPNSDELSLNHGAVENVSLK